MIVSFHPCFSGDININPGGRELNEDDIAAIRKSSAVILPQACREDLYRAARQYGTTVFPDFDTRFGYPGKTGQIRLFEETGTAHPRSLVFAGTTAFDRTDPGPLAGGRLAFPLVFKFDWSEEGSGVFPVEDREELDRLLEKTARAEKTGQYGFILQEYVETRGYVLRVCVIYSTIVAYWRVRTDATGFAVNLAGGADIDHASYPGLREKGIAAVEKLCHQTGINLAGFDLVFSGLDDKSPALMLEINYYFGRRGLGGSETYYTLLTREIKKWINDHRANHWTPQRPGEE